MKYKLLKNSNKTTSLGSVTVINITKISAHNTGGRFYQGIFSSMSRPKGESKITSLNVFMTEMCII